MYTNPHGAVPRHLRSRWIVRGEKGAGVKVVGDSVVTTVKSGEKVPLVPADTGHAFEKRIDIDPDSDLLSVVYDAGMEASPTGAQGANRIAGDIDEEPECSCEAVEHGGQVYSNAVRAFSTDRGIEAVAEFIYDQKSVASNQPRPPSPSGFEIGYWSLVTGYSLERRDRARLKR